ncbi:MAG: heavy-metal-associated domain-containing protein [Planctomycetota bacterium]|nr:heavy-metal-associated domain-containing protein [Planctomycetota bacterium]MDA1180077.1 heavy-metal-associated domain-containing protein [Planctomycetota bacterium]
MLTRRFFLVSATGVLATVSFSALSRSGFAATPTNSQVVIHIKAIHCAACAKKISKKLHGVDGVHEVKADVKKDLAVVSPVKDKSLSARALWEAVEAAGFKPIKIVAPSGTYNEKPQS